MPAIEPMAISTPSGARSIAAFRRAVFSEAFRKLPEMPISRTMARSPVLNPPWWRSYAMATRLGNHTMRKLILLGLLLSVAACNTIEGAGRDMSSAGKAVAGAASDAKR
jgi:entericidin B